MLGVVLAIIAFCPFIWGFKRCYRVVKGRNGFIETHGGARTRVVCSTLPSRGKSLTPEPRIEMLEDRRALVERSEDTQESSGFAIM